MSANFIAGAYTFTYNSKAMGQCANGWRLAHTFFKRLITGDAGGRSPQDAVYQGREQTSEMTLIEVDEAAIPDIIDPYAGTVGTPWTMGVIGLLDVRGAGTGSPTSRCKTLIATAVTGTSAANDTQATITAPLTIIHEEYPIQFLLGPDLRELPLRFRHYPNMSTLLFGSNT